jgi:hypothetical protein
MKDEKQKLLPQVSGSDASGTVQCDESQLSTNASEHLIDVIPKSCRLVVDQHGTAHLQTVPYGPYHPIESKFSRTYLRAYAFSRGKKLRKSDLNDEIDSLQSYADAYCEKIKIYQRVASIPNGIEIDPGCDDITRIRVTPGNVEIVRSGSDTAFSRSPVSTAMVTPADEGDLEKLDLYLNMNDMEKVLLKGYLSYTLAHPKIASSSFIILQLLGDQGSGKSSLCKNIIQPLIDPNIVGVQTFPRSVRDLVVAVRNAHVTCFDNMRYVTPTMSDAMCTASTGGAISTRQLYTNADQHISPLHGALVLNGIHAFIDQPDLTQRTLPIELKPLTSTDRKSEGALLASLQTDMPIIFRGLLDLIAEIFTHLPKVKPTNPERMYDFSEWLTAYEMVDHESEGTYQDAYSSVLNAAERDTLLSDPLAEAVYRFAKEHTGGTWSGTPTKLLLELDELVNLSTQRSRDWPSNAISLSKRLKSLKVGLLSQKIRVELTRGKDRKITVTDEGQYE